MANKNQEKLIDELNKELEKLENAMRQFDNGILLLQNENGGNLPWNGKEAYSFLEKGLVYSNHNTKLLYNLTKCAKYLNKLDKESN